jgi:hypothetical protein
MTSIQQRSAALAENIHSSDYYLNAFNYVLALHGMTVETLAERADAELVSMWNAFWMNLPDNPTIRRAPFFEMCDLCEEIF